MKPLNGLICILLILTMPTLAILAQEQTKLYVSPDGTLTFQYPAGWLVEAPPVQLRPGITPPKFTVQNMPDDKKFDLPESLKIEIVIPQKRPYYGLLTTYVTPAEIAKASAHADHMASPLTFATPSADGTPELLELKPASVAITEFTVEGRPAASMIDSGLRLGLDETQMLIVIDVGNDFLIAVTVNAPKGGIETVKRYEPVITALAQSIRYKPIVQPSGNAQLPQVFSGPDGIATSGTFTFFYPAKWVAFSNLSPIIQNSTQYINSAKPASGQVIAVVKGPADLRASLDPMSIFSGCTADSSKMTVQQAIEKLTVPSAAQAAQLKARGITISTPEYVTVNGKTLGYFYESAGDVESLVILADLGNGIISSLSAVAKIGEMKNFAPQILAIAGTLDYKGNPCDGFGAGPTK